MGSRHWVMVGLLLACCDDSGSGAMSASSGQATGTSSSGHGENTTTSSGTTGTDGTIGDPSASETDIGDPTTAGTTTTDEGDTSTTTGPLPPDANGCPGDAPESWVLCEDFDAVVDPSQDLSQWNVAGNRFGVEQDETGEAGDQALRMSLIPGGGIFGGWVTLRFGQGPEAPNVDSPTGHYDDIWLRYRFRTNDGWPGHSAGDIGEIASMNGENWGLAADLNLYVDNQYRMHPRAWSCIFDGQQPCDGQNDWGGTIQMLWSTATDHVLTGSETAGAWRCIEARLQLNDVGETNGTAEVWVDDEQVFTRNNIDWRGTWDEYGLNAIRFTNYANSLPTQQDFFIDDVVAATERVGCHGIR